MEASHAILQHPNPLHAWGWKLAFRKGRSCAAIAVARKLTVACWYLMQGFFTPLQEVSTTLRIKLRKTVTVIGRQLVRQIGFPTSLEYEQWLHQSIMTA